MTHGVWAPAAERVELVLGSRRLPMVADEAEQREGWWVADGVELPAGTDYAFSIDGGPARPDPRSAWLPNGVHGPSRVVDHAAFEWTDDAWRGFHWPAAVVYEMHVGTFTPGSTFDSAIERLDHLVDLGVSAVEVMPVAAFPGKRGWGYDGVGLWAVHEPYGGPDAFKRFVDACHARGLGVVLDVVYNHVGPSGNYLSEFGPYFTDRYATPWGPLVNFDGPGSDEVRAFVIENALMWLRDYHIDGLRLDAVDAIDDRSATNVLEELVDEVERLAAHVGRSLWVTAENDQHDPVLVRSRDANGYGLHAQWNDDFHHAVHVALTGERSGYYIDFDTVDVAAALENGFVLAGGFSTYRGRTHGRALGDVPFWRLVAFVQNHDQIGNRARGDRLAHLVPPGGAKVAAALLLTAPFVPLLFQGEEWAASTPFQYFVDHEDPEFAAAVRDGRRNEFAAFGWDPDEIPDPNDEATFLASQLDWSEVGEGEHRDVLAFYRSLIRLRRQRAELTDGLPAEVVGDWDTGVFQSRRGALAVVVNLSKEACDITDAPGAVLLASDPGIERTSDGGLHLPPHSVAIIDLDR